MTNTDNQLILITDVAVGKFQEMLFDADKRDIRCRAQWSRRR